MKFGPVPLSRAKGAVLAHSIGLEGQRLRKGRTLTAGDIAALDAAGIAEVTVAALDESDVDEDSAAAALADALAPDPAALGLKIAAPFTGRVNLHATQAGILRLDADALHAINRVDPSVTIATLPDARFVAPRTLVATVKVIPYAVPADVLNRAIAAAQPESLYVAPVVRDTADLILTEVPGMKPSLLSKGQAAVEARLATLGVTLASVRTVPHDTDALADALGEGGAALTLILGGSATSDAADVGPAAVEAAGGHLERFGMPVDPGNLLFTGQLNGRPVIGLPGCARAPALNGADWVLQRVVCGQDPTPDEIAAMGVGGLLKEAPIRPQPRSRGPVTARAPKVAVLLLAAGAARRMEGRDKLLEPVDAEPLLRRQAERALASGAARTVVVLPPDRPERAAALEGLDVRTVIARDAAEGMGASLRRGVLALDDDVDAALVMLADMPEIDTPHIDRLIAAFSPDDGREIIRSTSADGQAGHPVLFGRRYFESLAQLGGDQGARSIVAEAGEHLVDVPLDGVAAITDLDTPAQWAAWRKARGEG
ncbi:NTP transferase domain-containing protein [Oceanomicrobium pacificus]|uniref:NTP transferase domain-containing protein n=1 Tax=Oceanomicrobium pacificus TaxID=2692916 RepID=A0A6B0TNJ9_9RHOB|nr:molybdopterin-binding/glycosyltransferase family 2 protein [Oceanomicrobium pacificus]MXU66127.1 NTP transferase domain-containing protein [Oceanomicrobium pacificus]